MSVEILTDTTRQRECLMCNTTDTVFGPVMALGEAEEFLEHLAEIEIADARHVARGILVDLYESWKTTRDEKQRQEDGPSDDEIYNRAGVEGGIAYDTSADEPGSLGENDWRL